MQAGGGVSTSDKKLPELAFTKEGANFTPHHYTCILLARIRYREETHSPCTLAPGTLEQLLFVFQTVGTEGTCAHLW